MLVTRTNLEAIAAQFEGATCPEAVFGALAGAPREQLDALRFVNRALTRGCHPDLAAPADKPLATRLFQELGAWEEIAKLKIEAGTYGDFQTYTASPAPYAATEIEVRGEKLTLIGLLAAGTFSDVHRAKFGTDATREVFVKIARDEADNDLLEREYRVLKTFQEAERDPDTELFLRSQRVYAPTPLATFSLLDDANVKHRANVLSVPQGRCFSAAELRRDKFPAGIEPKHVWWIFRRLLLTLWMAHLKGYIHGAVTPDHLLIYPDDHGVVLLDWTCAAKISEEHVPVINPEFEAFYPFEIFAKEVALPSTDLYMAAATALWMLGGDIAEITAFGALRHRFPAPIPAPILDVLMECLRFDGERRPQNAGAFHHEFGALLGRRVFSEMLVP